MKFQIILASLFLFTTFALSAQTGGETCATSVTLPIPATGIVGSTVAASDDYNEDCEGYGILNDGRDVVYNFTVPTTGYYDFTLCQSGTDYDTKFYIYETSCPAPGTGITGTTIGCDDDNCDGSGPFPWTSYMQNVDLTAGTTYYLVIDGYIAGEEGTYVLSVETSSSPPSGATLVLDDARSYDYSFIPQFNLTPSIFTAVVSNLATSTATGVVVDFTAIGPNDFTGALIDHVDVSAPVSIGPTGTVMVNGNAAWLPSDTGVYILEYVVSSASTPATANDTLFQFLKVTLGGIQSRHYTSFGGTLSATKLLYETPDTEYGAVHEVNANAELTGMTVYLSADPAFFGQAVNGSVYKVGVDIDDLTLVTIGVSPDLADPFQLIYDIPLSASLVPGDYIAAYNGNQFVVSTESIYTVEASDLVRDPVTTGGLWSSLGGQYAWAITFKIAPGVCNSSIPPGSLSNNVTASQLLLDWDKVPFSMGCQVNAGMVPGPFVLTRNQTGFEVSSVAVPLSIIPPGSYKARIRCVCSLSPFDVTAYSGLTLFTIPTPRLSEAPVVSVYPNPASDRLFVSRKVEFVGEPIQVVSILGELMPVNVVAPSAEVGDFSIDVSSLTAGLYFLEIGEEVIEFLIE